MAEQLVLQEECSVRGRVFGAYFVKFNETSSFLARGKPTIVESNAISDLIQTCLNLGRDRRKILRLEVKKNLYVKQVEKMTAIKKKNRLILKVFLCSLKFVLPCKEFIYTTRHFILTPKNSTILDEELQ